MPWREKLLCWFGPSLFAGISSGDWWALLRENRLAVDPPYWLRAAIISGGSLSNALLRRLEDWLYSARISATQIQPPLFVLGIWRSGTTHLHNLLAVDRRFATPNWYQVSYPHTFLTTEGIYSKALGVLMPRQRMQDNMRFGLELPAEEEMALCILTRYSPMLGWVFPRNADRYNRYVSLRGVPETEIMAWKAALLGLVRKLTYKYQQPLLLKSPSHTARIRLLLELFPDARFVHIHRHPYAVIRSTRHTVRRFHEFLSLQRTTLDADEWSISQYRNVYEAFFAERDLIPPGRFYEVRYDKLDTDPLTTIRDIYSALGLPDFSTVESKLRSYLASQANYQKNRHEELDSETKVRIAHECPRCFDEWGYER
ncbi:MAG: sulfotransferase [Pirellulales bacterium]|nr:sulfotransferase [Pirellulales bacterium]